MNSTDIFNITSYTTLIGDDDEITTTDIGLAFGITVLAGFAALIGALPLFCIKRFSLQNIIPIALGFSGGVTIHLAFLNLISHSIENFTVVLGGDVHEDVHEDEDHYDHRRLLLSEDEELTTEEGDIESLSHFYTLLCVILGILLMIIIEKLMEKYGFGHGHNHENKTDIKSVSNPSDNRPGDLSVTGNTPTNNDDNDDNVDTKLEYISYKIAVALILHHLPEGIATFVALVYEFEFGIAVALALSLHDIPAGISIASTVYCSTKSYFKPFIICFAAALAYPLGALIGLAIVNSDVDSELINAISFGIVSGIMIYISLIEIMPEMNTRLQLLNNQKITQLSYIALFLGLLVMEITVILLALTDFHSH